MCPRVYNEVCLMFSIFVNFFLLYMRDIFLKAKVNLNVV